MMSELKGPLSPDVILVADGLGICSLHTVRDT